MVNKVSPFGRINLLALASLAPGVRLPFPPPLKETPCKSLLGKRSDERILHQAIHIATHIISISLTNYKFYDFLYSKK